ncbi:hypothetical protein [Sphingomonas sp.]|uniref:hypothetical protein n=1 Tax=Sphingomonas sp. TaxID=28214 RepID=UPI003D6D5A7F
MARMIVFAIAGSLAACSASPVVNAAAAADANANALTETLAEHAASPAPSAVDALRGAIEQHFPGTGLKQDDRAGNEVATLIKAHVDPVLTRGATATEGHDLRFSGQDGIERHAGLFVVRFADAATATARSTKVVARRNAFLQNSEIRSPMAAAQAGPVVAIFYSESGGDPRMREVLDAAASTFGGAKPGVRE